MNEAKYYKDRIDNVYVDFYKKDTGFLGTFSDAISVDLDMNNKAYNRILKDIIELDLSKVEKLVDLM